MTNKAQEVLTDALSLSCVERAELVERILDSFALPDRKRIDALWAQEAEDRIDAFEQGEISARPISEVFEEIERGDFE